MRPSTCVLALAVAAIVAGVPNVSAQPPATPADALLKQSQQQLRDGNSEQALALAEQAVAANPELSAAHVQMGVLLDLSGQYAKARSHFQTAIDKAANPDESARALRSMAMSYAFEGDCAGATPRS